MPWTDWFFKPIPRPGFETPEGAIWLWAKLFGPGGEKKKKKPKQPAHSNNLTMPGHAKNKQKHGHYTEYINASVQIEYTNSTGHFAAEERNGKKAKGGKKAHLKRYGPVHKEVEYEQWSWDSVHGVKVYRREISSTIYPPTSQLDSMPVSGYSNPIYATLPHAETSKPAVICGIIFGVLFISAIFTVLGSLYWSRRETKGKRAQAASLSSAEEGLIASADALGMKQKRTAADLVTLASEMGDNILVIPSPREETEMKMEGGGPKTSDAGLFGRTARGPPMHPRVANLRREGRLARYDERLTAPPIHLRVESPIEREQAENPAGEIRYHCAYPWCARTFPLQRDVLDHHLVHFK